MNTLVVCSQCEKLNRVPFERATQAQPNCGHCKTPLPLEEGVQDVNGSRLDSLVKASEVPVVVDFWAEWCGPCKMFAPTFKAAAKDLGGKVTFAKLNTEMDRAAAQKFHIRGIPTLIVFKNGVEVDRKSGAMPLPMLKQYLAEWT